MIDLCSIVSTQRSVCTWTFRSSAFTQFLASHLKYLKRMSQMEALFFVMVQRSLKVCNTSTNEYVVIWPSDVEYNPEDNTVNNYVSESVCIPHIFVNVEVHNSFQEIREIVIDCLPPGAHCMARVSFCPEELN